VSQPDFVEVAKELLLHVEFGPRRAAEDEEWVAVQFHAVYALGYADGYAAAQESSQRQGKEP
jgi:hypothetical protein